MNDRKEIRWAPFQSLWKTNEIIKEIEERKKLKPKPILSEDEEEELQKKILEAEHTKANIHISYFYAGKIYQKTGKIKTIQKNTLKIFFQDHTSLYFEQENTTKS